MNHSRRLRLAALAGTILVTALVLAACGSSSNTSSSSAGGSGSGNASGSASGSAANRTKFTACLKAHGVTLPTRRAGQGGAPPGGGEGGAPPGGGQGGAPAGGGQGRPPGGGFGGGAGGRFNNPKFQAALKACGGGNFSRRRFTPNKAAITKYVACVKAHGYNLPAPNFSGKGAIFPASIEKSKKFQTASKACASDLRPQGGAGAPPPGGAGGGSSGSSSSST